MERTYNPCDECPRGIDRRNGSGNDYACRNCEFAKLRALGTVEELSALVKARDEGLLPKLPCKVGDDIFFVLPDFDGYLGYLVSEPHRVTEVGTRGFWTSAIPDDEPDAMSDFTPWSDFGKTAFLARAEAEAAIGGGGDG